MGLITRTLNFTNGLIPTAAQWNSEFDTVYNLVNGQLDSANVDKTSADGIMVLDTAQTRTGTLTHNGDVIIGNTYGLIIGGATQVAAGGVTSELQVVGTAGADASGFVGRWSADASGPVWNLGKSRNAAIGSFTIVADDDVLGTLQFLGDDGTDLATPGASIFARVNGTPGANDLPTEVVIATTADGASAVTERMRILASGTVEITGATLSFDVATTIDTSGNNALTLDTGTANTIHTGTVRSDTDATDDLGTASVMWRAIFCNAAFGNPIRLGSLRMWYDSTNTVLRVKHGSDPSSIVDGNVVMEG